LTAINILGVKTGAGAQKILTLMQITGILVIIAAGLLYSPDTTMDWAERSPETGMGTSFGLAMVFVLLTFGGWNEAAYISAELKAGSKHMVKALITGIVIITAVYFLINLSFVKVLGLEGMAESQAIAGDLMSITFGKWGALMMVVLVAVAALTSANATIFTGARSNYALGRDYQVFSALGKWNYHNSVPLAAFLVQGLIALLLVSLGLFSRDGFETMVEYTAPVFWFFFLLVGIALFILRKKYPGQNSAYQVPLYPLTPIVFCLTSAYLLYSSVMYTGWGALVGIGVLIIGFLPLLYQRKLEKKSKTESEEL
jgi:basic amino acid/polyamine antiporter, APA family